MFVQWLALVLSAAAVVVVAARAVVAPSVAAEYCPAPVAEAVQAGRVGHRLVATSVRAAPADVQAVAARPIAFQPHTAFACTKTTVTAVVGRNVKPFSTRWP